MTKELKFQNSQKYILLKRISSKFYIKLSPFRSSPPEVFSKEDVPQTSSKPKGEHHYRSTILIKPLCNFIKITHMHRYAFENLQHICRVPPLPGEHLWRTASAC